MQLTGSGKRFIIRALRSRPWRHAVDAANRTPLASALDERPPQEGLAPCRAYGSSCPSPPSFRSCTHQSPVPSSPPARSAAVSPTRRAAVLPGVRRHRHPDRHRPRPHHRHQRTGQYTIPSLPIGPYRLEVSLQGFRTFVQSRHHAAGQRQPRRRPGRCRVGELQETITVTARPSDVAVETRSMAVASVIERERILELPLPAATSRPDHVGGRGGAGRRSRRRGAWPPA